MIEQLKLKAKEIIRMCNNIIALNNSPNEFVINIIKREFELILDSLEKEGRVIVLTKRPAVIKSIYEIKLTNKSTPINNRKCKEFNEYYDKIWRDLDVHI